MEPSENIERCWLTLLACPCPNCGYPIVHMLLPGFEPTKEYLNRVDLGIDTCSRCGLKHRSSVAGAEYRVVPWKMRNDFQRHNEDK